MDVLVTGPYGKCGTALIDNLYDDMDYDFTNFNRSDRPPGHRYGNFDTVVGNVTEMEKLRATAAGHDALVHMAAFSDPDSTWSDVFEPNIIGTYYALEAARQEQVDSFVFLSTNHVMGMYEQEQRPGIYTTDHNLVLDHSDPVRPDSYYGVSKAFGEDLSRYYVEAFDYPNRVYVLRVCTVNMPEYDHPYGDAERGVDHGQWEPGSQEYRRQVARLKSTWQSRRDFAHQIDCCLQDESVEFDIFSGVSDNHRRWFDLEHARVKIGYQPQDDASEW